MGISKCRGCGANLIYIKTAAGKHMPCDPPLVPYWPREGGPGRIVTMDGRVVACDLEGPREKARFGRVSHFATCPAAGRFKR